MVIDVTHMHGLRRLCVIKTQMPVRAADARSDQEHTQQTNKPIRSG